jgi:hypothetical protein
MTYLAQYLHGSHASHASCLLNLKEPKINGSFIYADPGGSVAISIVPQSLSHFTFYGKLDGAE